jgi:hypothetical protein
MSPLTGLVLKVSAIAVEVSPFTSRRLEVLVVAGKRNKKSRPNKHDYVIDRSTRNASCLNLRANIYAFIYDLFGAQAQTLSSFRHPSNALMLWGIFTIVW